jgi:hypothetical protein
MIHFLTIVLNGMPFIRHHLPVLLQLPFRWHWHIVEGVAEQNHDTAWGKRSGGAIQPWMHANGLSNDGTTEYLDTIGGENLTVYRKPRGQRWDGKLEMVNAPLAGIKEPCLLWEIDADELWTAVQIMDAFDLFEMNPKRQSAFYRCHFFVGPDLVIQNEEVWGNRASQEWKRTWRFHPGDVWGCHEPPRLMRGATDVARIYPFTHEETKCHGLVFQHLGYVLESQLRFKEVYYGYRNAVKSWLRLQSATEFPVKLSEFLPWVTDKAVAVKAQTLNIDPLFVC